VPRRILNKRKGLSLWQGNFLDGEAVLIGFVIIIKAAGLLYRPFYFLQHFLTVNKELNLLVKRLLFV